MIAFHLRGLIEHYFAPHPSQQVRALFISTAVLNFATSAITLFEPLYLHNVVGFSLHQILLFYGSVYVLYFFMLPLGGRISRRHGYEHTMLFSTPFLIIWYLALFAIQLNHAFAAVAVVALVMQKILYWPGYHANFASFGSRAEQGREVSNISAIAGLMAVVAPAIGGAVIAQYGYTVLFIGVATLILLSNAPLLKVPELYQPQRFEYAKALKRPFRRDEARNTLSAVGFGEEFIAMAVWPIFMAIAIPNLTSLGLVVSLAMLLNVASVLYVGRLSDEGDRSAVLRSGVLYECAAWLVRPLVATGGLGVFLIDTFYRVSKNIAGVPLLSAVYDHARDGGSGDVMERIVQFEMGVAIGKATASVFAALILWQFPNAWWAVFVLAAAYALLYSFAAKASKKSAGAAPLSIIEPTHEPV